MSVRKLITLPDLGAALLDKAAPPAGRGAGDYITAVLSQRHRAWTGAVAAFDRAGIARAKILALLEGMHGQEPTPAALAASVSGVDDLVDELRDLLLEYNAGNAALRALLVQE